MNKMFGCFAANKGGAKQQARTVTIRFILFLFRIILLPTATLALSDFQFGLHTLVALLLHPCLQL